MKCRNIRITCRTDCRKQGERKDERMKRKDGKMKRWKDERIIATPLGVPADLQSAVKKGSTY